MTPCRYGVRDVRHCPDSPDIIGSKIRCLFAHSLTVIGRGSDQAFLTFSVQIVGVVNVGIFLIFQYFFKYCSCFKLTGNLCYTRAQYSLALANIKPVQLRSQDARKTKQSAFSSNRNLNQLFLNNAPGNKFTALFKQLYFSHLSLRLTIPRFPFFRIVFLALPFASLNLTPLLNLPNIITLILRNRHAIPLPVLYSSY